MPIVFSFNENLEAIIPPMISEEVASIPHKNAFSILIDFNQL
jgi:hypothetical protein